MKYLLYGVLMMLCSSTFAQEDCPCCTQNYSAFDFWIGDWNVYDTSGQKVGENTIEKIEDGCIVSESWKGASGTTGKSYNFYSRKDSLWHQVWVDNRGGNLFLEGRPGPDKMILRSDLTEIRGQTLYHQITWSKINANRVEQFWESLNPEGQRLRVIFHGIYQRK